MVHVIMHTMAHMKAFEMFAWSHNSSILVCMLHALTKKRKISDGSTVVLCIDHSYMLHTFWVMCAWRRRREKEEEKEEERKRTELKFSHTIFFNSEKGLMALCNYVLHYFAVFVSARCTLKKYTNRASWYTFICYWISTLVSETS